MEALCGTEIRSVSAQHSQLRYSLYCGYSGQVFGTHDRTCEPTSMSGEKARITRLEGRVQFDERVFAYRDPRSMSILCQKISTGSQYLGKRVWVMELGGIA